jgi:hypothetical protein
MTLSIKIKELMVMMPDTLNSKKDVDDYYKDAMKKSVENKKTNDNTKPKKALNEYQKFMKENIKTIKEKNPKLTGPEVFSMIAKLWKKEKEENTTSAAGKEKKENDVVPSDEEEDIEVSAVNTEISVDTADKVKEVVAAKKKDKKAK